MIRWSDNWPSNDTDSASECQAIFGQIPAYKYCRLAIYNKKLLVTNKSWLNRSRCSKQNQRQRDSECLIWRSISLRQCAKKNLKSCHRYYRQPSGYWIGTGFGVESNYPMRNNRPEGAPTALEKSISGPFIETPLKISKWAPINASVWSRYLLKNIDKSVICVICNAERCLFCGKVHEH